ncbi:hypothetical protein PCE1_001194 [Barthelona sp. PCE]
MSGSVLQKPKIHPYYENLQGKSWGMLDETATPYDLQKIALRNSFQYMLRLPGYDTMLSIAKDSSIETVRSDLQQKIANPVGPPPKPLNYQELHAKRGDLLNKDNTIVKKPL